VTPDAAASAPAIQQAQQDSTGVTCRPATAAERKRRQRERERLVYETPDWRLFCDWERLPQKAGCEPLALRQVVLKELVDNALDAGANVALDRSDDGQGWVVSDDGPGLDPAVVPVLFCVNRPLRSSKLIRLPTRGLLGNGLRVVMGAVSASGGSLVVETRGRRVALGVCQQTGETLILSDEPTGPRPGVTVRLVFGNGATDHDAILARRTIDLAGQGKVYAGPSSPWWYGVKDLHELFLRAPDSATVADILGDLGFATDDVRPARTLDRDEVAATLARLRDAVAAVPPSALGGIGRDPAYPGYAMQVGTTRTTAGAVIPFVVEVRARCERGQGTPRATKVVLNRSATPARVGAFPKPGAIELFGCDLNRNVRVPGGDYEITISVTAPHIQLANDGKQPFLAPFGNAIAEAVRKACGAAHRAVARPQATLSQKKAAWRVMSQAYHQVSRNVDDASGKPLPANARQIMYAARPNILGMTGKGKLDSNYFTQTLLPDYVLEHPEETRDWDVVFDARGHFVEPHTNRQVPLGTLQVRWYVGERPAPTPAVRIAGGGLYPTFGPRHRYGSVLFIEKEGFDPLLEAARIMERFDVAVMSTKGMSTTAARMLVDRVAPLVDKVLVLHDFDTSGFSIFGTLGKDSRRYRFANRARMVDIGLRLSDVTEMDLQSEPVTWRKANSWSKRRKTLELHGATPEEIAFLRKDRVELNAMTSSQFMAFLERKLVEHGVRKIVPDRDTMERHARSVIEHHLASGALRDMRDRLKGQAGAVALPEDMDRRVRALLERDPSLPWDEAVASVALGVVKEGA
jgi:hypothetical protein